jgi:hypothetical protein
MPPPLLPFAANLLRKIAHNTESSLFSTILGCVHACKAGCPMAMLRTYSSAEPNPEPHTHIMKLLSIGADTKTVKGEARGYRTAILYLAPSNLSGRNVCPWATPDCIKLCLNTAGRGGFNSVQRARIAKTQFFHERKGTFMATLWSELTAFARSCRKSGVYPALRLNGTSDIRWDRKWSQAISLSVQNMS